MLSNAIFFLSGMIVGAGWIGVNILLRVKGRG